MNRRYRNCFLLFLAAFVWGIAFVSQSKGMEYVKPFSFLASRNILGATVLVPLILYRNKNKECRKGNVKTNIAAGVCCGIVLTIASFLQQYGIIYTTVGKAGFITTLYIIFTPILGIFIGKKAPVIIWIGALTAAFGLYLLCMTEHFYLDKGDLMILLSALFFSVHILLIDFFSSRADSIVLSGIQFFVCFALCALPSIIIEKTTFEQIKMGILPILYAGIVSSGLGYTLQAAGQNGVNPTTAAVILSLESVIAAISGTAAYKLGILESNQTMTFRQVIGCAIVFTAVILVQLPWDKIKIKKLVYIIKKSPEKRKV